MAETATVTVKLSEVEPVLAVLEAAAELAECIKGEAEEMVTYPSKRTESAVGYLLLGYVENFERVQEGLRA